MTRNLLSLLKSAIALAETLNFSRAAKMRHISQPTLTKHISALEDFVGMSLFERDRQNVTILDSGRAFIEEARLSVLHFERAVQAARAVTQNTEAVLNIGRSPYTDPFLISTLSPYACRSTRPSRSNCSATFLVTSCMTCSPVQWISPSPWNLPCPRFYRLRKLPKPLLYHDGEG